MADRPDDSGSKAKAGELMTTYYVGPGGNNSNNGTTWALRKLTLNGAEDIPVQAGDTVYVGAGTYREQLTCDVSGSSGSPITYIGDYDGSHTDGTGGVVRITGSNDDQTVANRNGIFIIKNYRTFRGFVFDSCGVNYAAIYSADTADVSDVTVDSCFFAGQNRAIMFANRAPLRLTVTNCFFSSHAFGIAIGTAGDDRNNVINNCLFIGSSHYTDGAIKCGGGGTVIKNCTFYANYYSIYVPTLNAGQTVTVNNCNFYEGRYGLVGQSADDLVEDYNNIYSIEVARSNVATGAHSTTYISLFDTRWFFEMISGGSMLTPFDLASYSQLINVAGTSPTTADMRGTTVQGTQREWGALEYDSTLDIEAGSGGGGGGAVRILPFGGIGL